MPLMAASQLEDAAALLVTLYIRDPQPPRG
jgi:hypothetical protein